MSALRTPLRYPGGKQKLAPFVVEVLEENNLVSGHYAEPYAGGAGVGIALLLENKVSHIHLNDSCPRVYAFWRSILDHTEEFCRRIIGASLTIAEWKRQKEIFSRPDEFDVLDLGFSMFFLNRCNRSGIASAGVIGGINQDGRWKIDARFPKGELIRRIQSIASKRNDITLKNWDAERFLKRHVSKLPKKSLIYCDPPYFNKADRLYLNYYKEEDHVRLAKLVQKELKHPWLVSYDNSPQIAKLYQKRNSFIYDLQYNAAKAYKGKELFVFSDNIHLPSKSCVPAINAVL